MRSGKLEEAASLASMIGIKITKLNSNRYRNHSSRTDSSELWSEVRDIMGKNPTKDCKLPPTITADTLNTYYARISHDNNYTCPPLKLTASVDPKTLVEEQTVFHILDHLKTTATGPDLLPSWFLRLGAPFFAAPIAKLFNLSIMTSNIPKQWKHSIILKLQSYTREGGIRFQTYFNNIYYFKNI